MVELIFILVIGWALLKTEYREPAWRRSRRRDDDAPYYSLRLDSGDSMDRQSRDDQL